MSHAFVSFTDEEAHAHLFPVPSQLDDAIQATNAALQLMMCAKDLTGTDKDEAMVSARKLHFRSAALLSREIEEVVG